MGIISDIYYESRQKVTQMILIVDDKAENIFSLKKTLQLNGFEVDSAGSGEEALKKILNTPYTLIILDVQMPGMDGFEVAEILSGYSKAKDIPIIFLSAVNTDKKFITKGYTAGGADYVTKPVDPDLFILRVKTLHRLYEQNRELNLVRLNLLDEIEIRKTAELELKKNIQEQRSILESMPQVAFTLKSDGRIEYVNEQWWLYSEDEKKMPMFHPSDEAIAGKIKSAIKEGNPVAAEARIKNLQTGDFRYHLFKLTPVKEGKEILKWVGTFTDIHEQKSANEILEQKVKERTEELVDKNKELETTNHELQQFAFVASHDLKEPLRKIRIFSSIIKQRFHNEVSEENTIIDRVIESSKRMTGLINDLLDYSRLSVAPVFSEISLRQLINEIINDLELTILEKNAVIEIGELPTLKIIPAQMRQVFQNLISNSLKFSKEGIPPVIKISSEFINMEDGEQFCRISVSDNGIGFNDKYIDKMFAIFQRLNARESYEGTGIGLAIVKKVIEKHNGTITAYGREGEGATFVMTLPVHQTETLQLDNLID